METFTIFHVCGCPLYQAYGRSAPSLYFRVGTRLTDGGRAESLKQCPACGLNVGEYGVQVKGYDDMLSSVLNHYTGLGYGLLSQIASEVEPVPQPKCKYFLHDGALEFRRIVIESSLLPMIKMIPGVETARSIYRRTDEAGERIVRHKITFDPRFDEKEVLQAIATCLRLFYERTEAIWAKVQAEMQRLREIEAQEVPV